MRCGWCSIALAGAACGPGLVSVDPAGSTDGESTRASASDDPPSDGSHGDDDGDSDGGEATANDGPSPTDLGDDVEPGELLWAREYDGETHNLDVGVCVAVPDDDRIIVGGFEVLDPFGSEIRSWLARLDGDGDIVWLEHDDRARHESVVVTNGGRVLTAGTEPAPIEGTGWDMIATSHDPDGVEQWKVAEHGDAAYDVAAIDEDVIVVGATAHFPPLRWISRRDSIGGQVYGVPGEQGTSAIAVVADADTFVVAGGDLPDGSDVVATWLWTFDSATGDGVGEPVYIHGLSPLALARDANGIVLLARKADAIEVARVSDGDVTWSDVIGTAVERSFEWDITIDAAGNIVVAGSIWSPDADVVLRKYTPDGSLVWERFHSPGVDIQVNGVATAPNGDIVAVGSIRNAATDDDIWVSRWAP
jgi:hypothetical protein